MVSSGQLTRSLIRAGRRWTSRVRYKAMSGLLRNLLCVGSRGLCCVEFSRGGQKLNLFALCQPHSEQLKAGGRAFLQAEDLAWYSLITVIWRKSWMIGVFDESLHIQLTKRNFLLMIQCCASNLCGPIIHGSCMWSKISNLTPARPRILADLKSRRF